MDEEKIEETQSISNEPLNNSNNSNQKKSNITKQLRQNPWILSTLVLGIVVLILLTGTIFKGGITGNAVSETTAGNNLVEYLNTIANSEITLVSVEEDQGMYLVTVGFEGDEIPVYVTKDGEFYTTSLLPIISSMDSTDKPEELPKSDKPLAELFIWSYCPYGVQALTPFAEVASLLKNYADFSVVLYYDGHGDFETQQNKIQACIQKLDKEKYWDYASIFEDEIYGAYTDCYYDENCQWGVSNNLDLSATLMKSLGIDSDAVMSCVESQGEELLSDASARAKEVGVTGSPSLVINDFKASPSSRTAEAFKNSICSAFNSEPNACETELDSTATTASGNC